MHGYVESALLIANELGCLSIDKHGAELLFQIIGRGYELTPVGRSRYITIFEMRKLNHSCNEGRLSGGCSHATGLWPAGRICRRPADRASLSAGLAHRAGVPRHEQRWNSVGTWRGQRRFCTAIDGETFAAIRRLV
jgi:hypothetical protein